MSLEPGVKWTQETNSSSCLVIGDVLIRWAGACWRMITRVSLQTSLPSSGIIVMHTHFTASPLWSAPHPLATSPVASWCTELCLSWHILNLYALLPILLQVCMPCECRKRRGTSLLAWEKGKNYSTGTPTVAKPFPIMFSSATTIVFNPSGFSCPLFVILALPPSPPSMPSHTQAIVMKIWFMTVWVHTVWVIVLPQFEETIGKWSNCLPFWYHITSRSGFAVFKVFDLASVRFGEQK